VHEKLTPILNGNHDFMTILFAMFNHLKGLGIISKTTLRIGDRIINDE
jgi:hypothetical protein